METSLLLQYNKVAERNQGKWFALTSDGQVLAIATSNKKLWKKIREKLNKKELKELNVIIGYSQTKKERETACLLPSPLINAN
jgi:hypothetical protein